MPRFYPTLDTATLSAIRTVQRLVIEDPEYLHSDECPYTPDTIRFFAGDPAVRPEAAVEVPLDDLTAEAESLLRYVKGLRPTASDSEMKDGIDYARAATNLLDKLLGIKERAAKMKDVAAFEELILAFMQDILTPEQRTLLMDKIQNG